MHAHDPPPERSRRPRARTRFRNGRLRAHPGRGAASARGRLRAQSDLASRGCVKIEIGRCQVFPPSRARAPRERLLASTRAFPSHRPRIASREPSDARRDVAPLPLTRPLPPNRPSSSSDLRALQNKDEKAGANAEPRFRVMLSDGTHYVTAMLTSQLNSHVIENRLKKFTVVQLEEYFSNEVQGRKCVDVARAQPGAIWAPLRFFHSPRATVPRPTVLSFPRSPTASPVVASQDHHRAQAHPDRHPAGHHRPARLRDGRGQERGAASTATATTPQSGRLRRQSGVRPAALRAGVRQRAHGELRRAAAAERERELRRR